MHRSRIYLVVLVTALLASLGAARRAEAAAGLQVTPVIIDKEVTRPGQMLPPITVINPGLEEVEVTVSFGTVGHDAFGSPQIDIKDYAYTQPSLFKVKKNRFKLAPKASTTVEVQVAKMPKGKLGASTAVYLLAKGTKPTKALEISVRMVVILQVTFPGTARHVVTPVRVFGLQDAAGGPVAMFAQIRNDGDVHEEVTGTIIVKDARGKEIGKAPLNPASVYPGLVRALRASWQPPAKLAAGKYKLTATMKSRSGTLMADGDLVVVKPGTLASQKALITKLPAPPVVKKKPLAFEATIKNQGNVAFKPAGRLRFLAENGSPIASVPAVVAAAIPAGGQGAMKAAFPGGLPEGKYSLVLEVLGDYDVILATRSAVLQVLARDPNVSARIGKFNPPAAGGKGFQLELVNDGNAEVDAEGIVEVADSSGNIVGQVVIEKRSVKPGKATTYDHGLPSLEPGLYELRATVQYGGKAPATKTIKHYAK